MSVYVDDMFHPSPGRFQGWCHLVADTDEELHAFAAKIGLKREWFQLNTLMNHYDISRGKRLQAIREGAIAIGCKDLTRKFVDKREAKKKGDNDGRE